MKSLALLEVNYERALQHVAHARHITPGGHENVARLLEQQTHHAPTDHSRLLVLSGLSGVGKKTTGKALEKHGYRKMCNVFARPMRPYETEADGVFVSKQQFDAWDKNDLFVTTTITNGSHHGLLRRDFLEALEPDAPPHWTDKSVHSVKKLLPFLQHYHLYYLLPPSFDEIARRIAVREQNNPVMSETAIVTRFEHELEDLRLSADLPYSYLVSDSVERILPLLIKA